MKIDVHTHMDSRQNWLDYNKRTKGKIDKVVAMAWCKNGMHGETDTDELQEFARTNPAILATGSVDMDKPIEPQLEKLEQLFKDKKIVAIKLYPGYQYFYPSDEKIFPIAQLCAKYNKPLILHSGDVYDLEGTALLKYAQPIHIDELAIKNPKTKIVISHLGFPYFSETANILSKNPNVYSDISGTIDKCETVKEITDLKDQYIADLKRLFKIFPDIKNKIMFGTDYSGEDTSLNQVELYLEVVKKVFTKKEQTNVMGELAQKIYLSE